jgi:hypothetical protein
MEDFVKHEIYININILISLLLTDDAIRKRYRLCGIHI